MSRLAGPGVVLVALLTPVPLSATPPADPPEVRAVWVDAFGPGIRSPEEAEELVLEAKRANLNLLFVQVRRRGDALYTRGVEPPLDAPAYDPRFDALENVIRLAHREGLAVHAWVNAMPVWRNEPPPCDARHLFNRHGPSATGDEMWLTTTPDGATLFPVGTFLDPGHPGVQEYLPRIYANLVREYDLDGIHFDYIRYPETEEALGRGSAVGYNPAALARFRMATGRTGTPEPGDEEWMAWRRRQVSHVVRRVFLEAKALKPRIVVSASVIPWGARPRTRAALPTRRRCSASSRTGTPGSRRGFSTSRSR
ncbi:MAG: family 10 glycosylhydrolase [Holophagales bacterium]|nr:family 10 glycosylhydrolase [Holophagales bacterium]